MGTGRMPTEGGSGGKRGHSAMDHWACTAEIKDSARIRRRIEDHALSRAGIAEHDGAARHPYKVSPGRRQLTSLQRRRNVRYCPVCLARLQRNVGRTRTMRRCTACAAHPQATKTCLHCGQHALWQSAGLMACRSCGRHGRAAAMLGPAD